MSSFTVNTFPTCATRVADVVAEALQADATTRFGVGIRIEGDESTWRLVVCVFFSGDPCVRVLGRTSWWSSGVQGPGFIGVGFSLGLALRNIRLWKS